MPVFDQLPLLLFWIVYQFKMIFPYWAVGLVAGSLVSVFAAEKIGRLAGRLERGGLGSIAAAALLGAASPICMYGTIPLIASFGRKGLPQHLIAAFMVSSILINPNLLLFSFALGAPLAVTRLACSLAAGVVCGLLVRRFFAGKKLFDFYQLEGRTRRGGSPNGSLLFGLLRDLNRAITKTAPYFLAGVFLAALFETFIPKNFVAGLFGRQNAFGILLAASLGVPIYVCGGGTIPLLKTWLDSGMSPGAAMAFMITGPATKITNLGAVKIILGARNFALYIAFNLGFAVVSGLLVDLFDGISRMGAT